MAIQTNGQKMAQAAYERIRRRQPTREFASVARSFPSLVHSCGLAQAIAFGQAKGHSDYLEDLAVVLNTLGHSEAASPDHLERATREHTILAYVRLSRDTLQAATWLKRYVEAVEQE
jgi:CRISPR-associated protein Cmr5